ncbi:MAG: tetratricopeptide repeat protein [Gammaproteobacteria bacterium]|nr:tetratricopeptide repeat protein [Gammaproteobacteria bacterium]
MGAEYLHGFYLGDLFIEPLNGRVTGPAGETHLPPTAADVLLCLVATPGDHVSREYLIEQVWGDGHGSSEALNHAISEIRHALGDHADDPCYIQTLPTRGYRLIVEPTPTPGTRPEDCAPPPAVGPRWWQALLRHGVIQASVAYLVAGWLLIQVADATFEQIGLPAWSEQFVTFVVIGGLPILVLLAWSFEFVGVRVETDRGTQSGGIFQGLERNYLAIFIAYGVAALGAGVYQGTVGFEGAAAPPVVAAQSEPELIPVVENSVAVLRLATFDDSPETKAFSDGLSEDILDGLARIPGLAVSARGDAWSLPTNVSSEQVRHRLRVANYLEGSVRFLDDTLRVVVQFIDSQTGFHRFSRDFEIGIASTRDMQEEITRLVVANLKVAVDDRALDTGDYATADPDAYVHYMVGREAANRPRTMANYDEAIAHFNRALALDAGFPAAHAGLCAAHISRYEFWEDTADIARAEEACSRAMSIAPRLPVVINTNASLRRLTGRYAEAESLYATALDIDGQNAIALHGLADLRVRAQRFDEAERYVQRAFELQPGNWRALNVLGEMYFRMGRWADAADAYRKVVFLDPENFVVLGNLAATSMMFGDFDSARDALLKSTSIEQDPLHVSNLAIVWYYEGEYSDAIDTFRQAIELAPLSVANHIGLADALLVTGNEREAQSAYAEAERLASDQLMAAPNDGEALSYLAWAQAMTGDDDAPATAQRAIELDPGDYYAHYYKALVELRAGDTDAAVDAAERALDAGYPVAVLAAEPILEGLWDNSRFVALMARHSVGGQQK